MDISAYSIKSISDDRIRTMLRNDESFVLENIHDMGGVVETIEKMIESMDKSCRVYTKGRTAALAGEIAIGGVGLIAAAAIGIHNLATWNPDYELAKNLITGTLTVTYKK